MRSNSTHSPSGIVASMIALEAWMPKGSRGKPPLRSITALAISNDEAPIIYAATFRTADHATGLWAYHDTGAAPKGPAVTPSPVVIQPVAVVDTSLTAQLRQLVQSSQAPYLALGGFAVLLILLAMVSNLRARRR